jgi:hypothetical protein
MLRVEAVEKKITGPGITWAHTNMRKSHQPLLRNVGYSRRKALIGINASEAVMDILSDSSSAALYRAIESNQIGFLEYFGRLAQVRITSRLVGI